MYVTGMHLSSEFGSTVRWVETDGFLIRERIEMLLASDSPEGIAKSMGLGTIGFAQAFARSRPDLLVVLGDRFEVHAAVLAALPFTIPVLHIHGGEVTEGVIDNALRDSITRMSHLHCVATESYAQRLIRMGEEPWRVSVTGALSLDNLRSMTLMTRPELESRIGLSLDVPPLLVTFHPVTLELDQTDYYAGELLESLRSVDRPIVFTMSNADTDGRKITHRIREFVREIPTACVIDNLGTPAYFSLMAQAAAMVGNSSSGIIEAMSFELPVVNIGTRQAGRIRSANVIDVGYSRGEITAGIMTALAGETRARLRGQPNVCGDGHAAERIVATIKDVPLEGRLLRKRVTVPEGEVARWPG
jgi:UDP-N-acetylglucosamine 2-epimerase (non-hydrolysing)/GDP/UDP-N,N'-diacetylbacillosamine 2-epimerase (hydrolysing)